MFLFLSREALLKCCLEIGSPRFLSASLVSPNLFQLCSTRDRLLIKLSWDFCTTCDRVVHAEKHKSCKNIEVAIQILKEGLGHQAGHDGVMGLPNRTSWKGHARICRGEIEAALETTGKYKYQQWGVSTNEVGMQFPELLQGTGKKNWNKKCHRVEPTGLLEFTICNYVPCRLKTELEKLRFSSTWVFLFLWTDSYLLHEFFFRI